MNNPALELKLAADTILAAVQTRLLGGKTPFLVALDGGSGAGKSTLAALVANALNAKLIPGDDFYAAHVPSAEWDILTPAEKAARAIDWRRLRSEALEPLLARKPAKWHPFDFENARPDGTYPLHIDVAERPPADVIILDGIYSSRPELADLIDFSVLVDVPVVVRHARLVLRENGDFLTAWHIRWDAAEDYYLTHIRPKASFDLVVTMNT